MQVHIMPIKHFLKQQIAPGHSAAILSTSADLDRAQIPCPYALAEYLDIDYESPRSFTPAQAAEFADFLRQNAPSVTDLYICCDAGESRSPAIAAAICRWLGQKDAYIWESSRYHPNVLCFIRMLDALGLSVTDEEIDALIYTNQVAFRQALRQTPPLP